MTATLRDRGNHRKTRRLRIDVANVERRCEHLRKATRHDPELNKLLAEARSKLQEAEQRAAELV